MEFFEKGGSNDNEHSVSDTAGKIGNGRHSVTNTSLLTTTTTEHSPSGALGVSVPLVWPIACRMMHHSSTQYICMAFTGSLLLETPFPACFSAPLTLHFPKELHSSPWPSLPPPRHVSDNPHDGISADAAQSGIASLIASRVERCDAPDGVQGAEGVQPKRCDMEDGVYGRAAKRAVAVCGQGAGFRWVWGLSIRLLWIRPCRYCVCRGLLVAVDGNVELVA
ncbi:hypothetical protein FB45DRAFT_879080 [Roridomyces roridus]|uniref:Uncharacterized protein n=1 Tax=Roridomyces roridus TaxID=1738132 RepID=A0AAD7F9R7_9AGAR|nr:hypothetical protein FB45DRAFT_879080 [Roridomyces roridus]